MKLHLLILLLTRYAGRLVVELTAKPLTIIEKLNQMVGFPFSCDEEIELYEVCAISIFICLVNIIDYKMKLKHHSIECQSQLSTHLNFGMLFFEFQEIRFMPLVLCEQVDKLSSFKSSEVVISIQTDVS